jgi:putative ABC transport system permease protein
MKHGIQHGLPRLESVFSDVRYGVRTLWKSPGFTLTAIATLAVGIGVNAAVFTVTNATLFKGFPLVHENDRILYVTTTRKAVYYPDFDVWRAQAESFEGMALVRGVFKTFSGTGGAPATYFATEVTANAFQLLSVKPILGRDFLASDQEPGAEPVVILRYDLWQGRFGQDPAIVGRTVRLNGVPTTVIGVMPQGFSFPEGQSLWTPLVPTPAALRRDTFYARYAFGRLAGGASIRSARAEMETIGRRLANTYPRTNRNLVPVLHDFREFFIGPNGTTAYKALWGAVGFVLLIACGNVANLLLQRAIGRSRETSIRLALGASRWRILQQLLIESLLLSSLAGVLGWWIAQAGVRGYTLAQGGGGITDVLSYAMDSRVLAYFIAISTGTGLLVGLAAAVHLTKPGVNSSLKEGGRGLTGGQRGRRLSDLLAAAEMALALMVFTGAGLMIRSFLNVYAGDVGVNTSNVLTMSMYIPPEQYPDPEAQISFYQRLVTRLEALPGVESVGLGMVAPTESAARSTYELANTPVVEEGSRPAVANIVVSPGYFRTLGVSVVSGRELNDLDRASSMPVAVVNQQFVTRNWPQENAVGKRLRLFRDGEPQEWLTVVGVVSDIVQDDRTRQEFEPLVYVPYRQRPIENMFVFARTRVSPGSLATAFAREVYAMDPNLPVPALMPLTERLSRAYAFERNITVLFLIFAAVALLLATVGLYATVAQAVSRRTQEIGIRTAMGATARNIRRLVFWQAALPLGTGLAVGLGASLAVTRILESVLVRVSPGDPVTLLLASLVMIVAGILGCLVPARRAVRVDPAVALRDE